MGLNASQSIRLPGAWGGTREIRLRSGIRYFMLRRCESCRCFRYVTRKGGLTSEHR